MTDGTAAATVSPAPAGTMRVRAERTAVSTLFTLLGVLFGSWVSRIPAAADAVGAGPGLLGLVLLAVAGGSVLGMPFVGRLCQRRSSTVVAAWLGVVAPLTLPLAGLAAASGSPVLLAAALAVFGAGSGGLDVSMNANAVAVIRHARRPLMPGFHGLFNVGGMLGAGAGGLATAAGVGIVAHFAGVAVIGVAATLLVARWLAADPPQPAAEPGSGRGVAVRQPRASGRDEGLDAAGPLGPTGSASGWQRAMDRLTLGGRLDALLLALGAITLCAALCEGAVADWSALFLRDVLDASDSAATTGFVVFSVVMAASRFGGGAVLRRWDPALVVAVGCLLAAGGTVLAVVAPVTAVAVIGFAAVGAGLACAIPVTFNAAGGHRLGSGPAISVVTTIGYTGFLAGPPLIGVLAQWAGLRVGLTAVAVFAAAGAALAVAHRDALRQHDPSRDPSTAE